MVSNVTFSSLILHPILYPIHILYYTQFYHVLNIDWEVLVLKSSDRMIFKLTGLY